MFDAVTDPFCYCPFLSVGAFNLWLLVSRLGWGTFHGGDALWIGGWSSLLVALLNCLLLGVGLWRFLRESGLPASPGRLHLGQHQAGCKVSGDGGPEASRPRREHSVAGWR
jgi:hypothetical protein